MNKKIVLLILSITSLPLHAMNIVRPYQIFFNPQPLPFMHVDCFARFEHGFTAKAYDCCSNRVNPLAIWNCDQDVLSMLKGFCYNTEPAQLFNTINAPEDCNRGHVNFRGDITADSCVLAARGYLPHNIMLGFYLPIITMRLRDVSWCDKTELITEGDYRTHHYFTDNLAENLHRLGCLTPCSWRRTGLGDIQLIGEWWQDFYQPKPVLNNVRLNARFGFGLPTGLKQDEDKLMAIPFGKDGAVTLMIAGGLNLLFSHYFHLGVDVQLQKPFGTSRMRRIKNHMDQTDLLFLAKTCAYKDFAIEQQYILYGEITNIIRGWDFKIGYQFVKFGHDEISLIGNAFNPRIANTAVPLFDHTIHSALGLLSYTGCPFQCHEHPLVPTASIFFEEPFNGTRSFACPILGILLAADF